MRPARQIRVLHVLDGLGFGRAERLVVRMTELADRNLLANEVAYIRAWQTLLLPELVELDVPTHVLAHRHGLLDPRWPFRLRSLAKQFDIVHLHTPKLAAASRPILRTIRRGPIVVSTEHELWSSYSRYVRVVNGLTMWLDRKRWAVSREVVDSMWERCQKRTEVIWSGIPVAEVHARREERTTVREHHRWADDDIVVAVVAHEGSVEEHVALFEAAAEATVFEPRLRFVSVGDGDVSEELRDILEEHRLGPRFQVVGFADDPVSVLAGVDAALVRVRPDHEPTTLCEAMALGLPVLVTNADRRARVVAHGVDGVYVGSDARALTEAFVRIAQAPTECARLGRAAAVRARDFDMGRMSHDIDARYRLLMVG